MMQRSLLWGKIFLFCFGALTILFSPILICCRMSNGGGFVGTLACDRLGSTLFAAYAMHSGAFYTDVSGPDNGCAPAHIPIPILEIHGSADKTVYYEGGQGDGGPEPPITNW
jgi:hypothetical protein